MTTRIEEVRLEWVIMRRT